MEKNRTLREVLSDYRDDFTLCGKCKLCHACDVTEVETGRFWRNCPSGTRFRYEGYYASGRLEMARALEQFEVEPTPALVDSLYSCMLCGACQERCYHVKEMLPMRVFELMREKAVREGWGPPPEYGALIGDLESRDNSLGRPQSERADWSKGLGLSDASSDKVGSLLFVGCLYSFEPALAEAAASAVRVLKKAGLDIGILGDGELCCGAPLLQLGDRDFFEAFADENLARMERCGAGEVISLCPHCSWVLSSEYGPRTDLEFRNVTEVLAGCIDDGRLKLENRVDLKAAWHDPCNLGRRLGVYEQPRDIMERIPGLDVKELERSRANSLCCGNGGMVARSKPDFAEWVAKERVFEAEFAGVDSLVTACPHCEQMLALGAGARSSDVGVMSIFSLLEKSAGGDSR